MNMSNLSGPMICVNSKYAETEWFCTFAVFHSLKVQYQIIRSRYYSFFRLIFEKWSFKDKTCKTSTRKTLKILFTSNYWSLCQNSQSWNMFWKEDHKVGAFKNICTVAIHFWHIKDTFAGFCQEVFESKNISEDILEDGRFPSNSKFISKSSSPLQRCKSFM